jgi:hypothetical protein
MEYNRATSRALWGCVVVAVPLAWPVGRAQSPQTDAGTGQTNARNEFNIAH